MKRLLRWVHYLVQWRRREAELCEELELHRQLVQHALEEQGIPAADATQQSRRVLGNVTLAREDVRAIWIAPSIESVWQDTRYALRSLTREPAFAVLALTTLALGIGATTAIFSAVYAIALKPLPYFEPDRLVMVWSTNHKGETQGASLPDLRDWQAQSHLVESAATFRTERPIVTRGPAPRTLMVAAVSPGFFETLGVPAARGRTLTPADVPSGRGVAVISYETWQQLGADSGLVGGVLQTAEGPVTVAGVMPAGFQFPFRRHVSVWLPMTDEHGAEYNRRARAYPVVGRLARQTTLEQAQREMDVIASRLSAAYPATNADRGIRLVPLLLDTVGVNTRTTLFVLLGAVGCVLLIACVNVANLLLARTARRDRELAIRTAIGAGRGRLIRQLLTESIVLGACAGAAGLLLARWTLGGVIGLIPANVPRADRIALDGPVLAFATIAALLTGAACGILPSLRIIRGGSHSGLNGGGLPASSATTPKWGRVLVFAETTVAIVLLVGAGLMLRSFVRLTRVDLGFDASHVVSIVVSTPGTPFLSSSREPQYYRALLERVRTIPGVQQASASNDAPFAGFTISASFVIQGRPESDDMIVQRLLTMPGYFSTMRIPIVQGRDFTDRDLQTSPSVGIINVAAARHFFPGENPIGQRIRGNAHDWVEIVGIVGDTKQQSLSSDSPPEFYTPFLQDRTAQFSPLTILLRLDPNAPPSMPDVQDRVKEAAGAGMRVFDAVPMEAAIGRSLTDSRFKTSLLTGFGALALLLSTVGIVAVMSHAVVQRTREIGIRLALGARERSVIALMMRQLGLPVALGIALGLLAARLTTGVLASLLFEITPEDPATFLAVAWLFAAVATLACVLPAHRAVRIDPAVTLRAE